MSFWSEVPSILGGDVLVKILWLGFISLILIYSIVQFNQWFEFRRKVNKLPGPDYIPFLGNIKELGWSGNSKDGNFAADRLNRIGKVIEKFRKSQMFRIWIGPEAFVFLFTGETVQQIVNNNSSNDKSSLTDIMKPWLGNGILMRKKEYWRSRRKELTPSFHLGILQDFMHVMNKQALVFVEILNKKTKDPWINIGPFISNCSTDIICETAMGLKSNFQSDKNSDYSKALHDLLYYLFERFLRPWLRNDSIYGLTKDARAFKKSLAYVNGVTHKVIQAKKAKRILSENREENHKTSKTDSDFLKKKTRKAFLDLLLDKHSADPEFTEQDMVDEINNFMFAGNDTIATTLTWTLFLLGHHPEIQEKLYTEITEVCGDNIKHITMDQIRDLVYLDMVIKESLRIYPAVPGFSRTVENDIKIGNYTVPKGCSIYVYTYFVHRDPNVFPNPEEFDPERFSKDNCEGRHPYAFIPFSAGQRNCIGKRFAMLEMCVILSHVLRNFTIKSLDARDKVKYASNIVLQPTGQVRLQIIPRAL